MLNIIMNLCLLPVEWAIDYMRKFIFAFANSRKTRNLQLSPTVTYIKFFYLRLRAPHTVFKHCWHRVIKPTPKLVLCLIPTVSNFR